MYPPPTYDNVFPYARIGESVSSSHLPEMRKPHLIWTDMVRLAAENATSNPLTLVFSTVTWLRSFLFRSKTLRPQLFQSRL